MTILEIILIGVLWVAYGVFSVYQEGGNKIPLDDADDLMVLVLGIVLSPLILVVRIFVGIFHKCTMNI
jgi:hypothetical protein